jgi:histidyl-tRNA synthetase
MSGGRYDTLIGLYAGQEIPAVGISVGVDRLLAGMIELGEISCPKCVTQVLLVALSNNELGYVLKAAAVLRSSGLNVEVYLDPSAKVKKAFKYADSLGISLVGVAGSDEVAQAKLSLKNMIAGTQELMTLESAARTIATGSPSSPAA